MGAAFLSAFERKQEYLLCVDSDGTVLDTMASKQLCALLPCLIAEWGLEPWEPEIRSLWLDINLNSMTRGIVRFKALAMALNEIDRRFTPITGLAELNNWVESGSVLSGDSLRERGEEALSPLMRKVLRWSEGANRAIAQIPLSEKRPFCGVREGLTLGSSFADVAVISTANREALTAEWSEYDLLPLANGVFGQDSGSKQDCIAALLQKGYEPERALMVGDAPADREAARANGIWFCPILPGQEKESWESLYTEGFDALRNGRFAAYGDERWRLYVQQLSK